MAPHDMSATLASQAPMVPRPGAAHHLKLLPGLALCAAITGAAYGLRQLPGVGFLSPMILAILLGMLFHNLIGTPRVAKSGVTFAMKRLLRFAIILLGLQLTLGQVAEVGVTGVSIIVATLLATFVVTKFVGGLLSVDAKLAELIAAGTSICGASAVIATNTVTEGPDEDVAYAVACVTIFGSLSMFLYPLLPAFLHLDAHAYGLWTGASIHEIAQVVAAAFQDGREAGEFGTIAKLSRVLMLAPLVLGLGALAASRRSAGHARRKIQLPWFVLGFIALVLLNSAVSIPHPVKAEIARTTTFLLAVALAAMGLETDVRKLLAKGVRPMLLGAFAWLFISGFSLALIKLVG